MMDRMLLLWYFLAAQPPARLGALLPWHLLTLLASLGLLSAFGIHFLMGHVAGFYRRRGRIARWVSLPSLLMLLISARLLLGAYLLVVHGSRLVSINQTDSVVNTLGVYLLEPAFDNPALAGASRGEIPKSHLKAAFRASTENRYREALAKNIVTPEKLTAWAQAGGGKETQQRSPLGERILVQVGMRWITAPHETWWAPLNPSGTGKNTEKITEKITGESGGGKPAAKDDQDYGFFLPVFLGGLLGELADDDQLSRANWEHVAGTRFAEGYLQPVMMEYLAYFAIALALAVLLINTLFFLALGRLKRIGLSRPDKTTQPVSIPVEDSTGETTGETTEENTGETTEENTGKMPVKSLPEPSADSGTENGTEITAEISTLAAKKTSGKISEETSEEISAAFPRTAGTEASGDKRADALPSPPGDGGEGGGGVPQGESTPQPADPKAEQAPGEVLLKKERKKPEPAGIVNK